jgi:DNA-binding CsgD family transcriptional regulator
LLREAVELAAELEYASGLADSLAGFAAAAAALDRSEVSATLLGATAALQERTALPVLPHHAQQQRTVAAVRRLLGEANYLSATTAGGAGPIEEAIAPWRSLESRPPTAPAATAASPLTPAALRAGLTAREVEILRLLIERRTDAEIAAALSISPRTATTHVARIREKLGVHTRREAAEVARRDGLT